MNRKSLLVLMALASAGTPALANGGAGLSADRLTTTAPQRIGHGFFQPPIRDPKLTAIFDNIGRKYPEATYLCCAGGTIGGPDSQAGLVWQAVQFTPGANATVTELEIAVQNIGGTNGVTIALYSDAGGKPATALASKNVTGLPASGSCCKVTTVKFRKGVAIAAGTPYWVVLETGSKTSTAWDSWGYNTTDQVDPLVSSINTGSGWGPGAVMPAFAFAVLGQ